MTVLELVLCNLGTFVGLLVYFAASKTDRSFVQSGAMAAGMAIVLVCVIVTAVHMFNSVVTIDIGQINTVTIPDIRIGN